MRMLSITDSSGAITEDAFQKISAVCEYPEDEQSRVFCQKYLSLRVQALEELGYKQGPSQFERDVAQRVGTAIGQKVAAGAVTGYLCHMALNGVSPINKYQASKFASQLLTVEKRADQYPIKDHYYLEGTLQTHATTVPTGRKNVETAFNRYASIGVIMCARILVGNETINGSKDQLRRDTELFTSLCQGVEGIVYPLMMKEFSNAWSVGPTKFVSSAETGVLKKTEFLRRVQQQFPFLP